MFRKSKIRYSNKDKNALRIKQQKVNARIYYERSKGGDTSHLPNTFKIKDLEDSIHTRADFNFQLSQLDKMLEKDAFEKVETKSGREITKGIVSQISNAKRRENIKRAYRRKEVKKRDKQKGKVLGSERSDALEKRDFDILDDTSRFYDKTVERILRMNMDKHDFDKAKMHKENYIKAIYSRYSSQDEEGNYITDENIEKLVAIVEKVEVEEFAKRYENDDRYDIQYVYQQKYSSNNPLSVLTSLWEE